MTSALVKSPTNPAAEWSVVAQMVQKPELIGEVIGTQLESRDFASLDTRTIYGTTVELYYSDRHVDPVTVAEATRSELARAWDLDEALVPDRMLQRVRESAHSSASVLEHAWIVKRLSTARQLLVVCEDGIAEIAEGHLSPEEIGDRMSTAALTVTSGHLRRAELLNWMDTGRAYFRQLQRIMLARERGMEIAVYTGLPFIDEWTAGIAPGELCFIAGDPGVGKTACAWAAARGFAERQLVRPPELPRVATLMLSMEMGVYPSTMRIVQALTGIDGTRLREGKISKQELRNALLEWKNNENLPMIFNFASNFRLSQMRALIVDAIRRHNVGLVVIDHFRMLDTDQRFQNPNQEDEAKVRFLKESVAKDLNIAVICLAHTVKVGRGTDGGDSRPRLSDLRGSGQIAAHADFVGFLYRPAKHAGELERIEAGIKDTDMELIWRKNRFGTDTTAYFSLDAKSMAVTGRT